MECLAVLDSGNFAFALCSILERRGIVLDVITTPCQLTIGGCGYCIKFPYELKDTLIREGRLNNLPVRAVYKVVPRASTFKYERIY